MAEHRLQQLKASLSERGVVGTSAHVFQSLGWRLRLFLDGSFDRKFGTDTRGFVAVDDLDFDSPSAKEAIWYEPVPTSVLRSLLRAIDVSQWTTFIDYGSGKGRALFVAAEFPFQHILGVEMSEQLHLTTMKNIEVYDNPARKCHDITSIHMDATEFESPKGPTVHFFYSPFTGDVMRAVLDKLRGVVATDSSPHLILFYGRNAESIEAMDALGWSRREIPVRRAWSAETKYRAFIYQSGEAAGG